MPKKLEPLKSLSIGSRHRLVFEAIEKYGLASIGDVLDYISAEKNLDLSLKNVKDSLKRSIENDLKALVGVEGKLGIKYYLRDGSTEVSIEDVEENKDGSVKNKYNLKYYLLGGTNRIPGINLLGDSNVKIEMPNKSTINVSVDRAYSLKEKKLLHIVFQKNGNEFYSVNFGADELPLGFIVCRNYDVVTPFEKITDGFGKRNFRICLNHVSVDRYLVDIRMGHCHISFTPDGNLIIRDLGSLNGTHYSAASENMVDLIFSKKITYPNKQAKLVYPPRPPETADLERMEFDAYYPFHNEVEWAPVKSSVTLPVTGYLVKVGAIIFYIGYSKLKMSDGGSKNAA